MSTDNPALNAELALGRERCCDQDYGGSHYHCGRCGEVASMMGHYVMLERMGDTWERDLAAKLGVTRPWKGFTCDPQNEREQAIGEPDDLALVMPFVDLQAENETLRDQCIELLGALRGLMNAWTSPKPDPTARPAAEAVLAKYDPEHNDGDPPLHCTAYAEDGGCGREDCPRCGRPELIDGSNASQPGGTTQA